MKKPRCASSQKRSFPPSILRLQNNTLVSWIYVEKLQKTERESPSFFKCGMKRRSLLPVPHRQARYRRAERRQATHTERTHVDSTKIGAAKGDACHKLQCLTGSRQHIRGLSGTGGHSFAKGHQQFLVRVLEHNVII